MLKQKRCPSIVLVFLEKDVFHEFGTKHMNSLGNLAAVSVVYNKLSGFAGSTFLRKNSQWKFTDSQDCLNVYETSSKFRTFINIVIGVDPYACWDFFVATINKNSVH